MDVPMTLRSAIYFSGSPASQCLPAERSPLAVELSRRVTSNKSL